MDITISISDDKINEIIRDNISGISQEQIADAIIEGIKQYIVSDNGSNIVNKILFNEDSYYYRTLSYQGKEILGKALSGSKLDELEGLANDLIKDNMKELMIEAIMKIFLENISNKIDLSMGIWNIQEQIRGIVKSGEENNRY